MDLATVQQDLWLGLGLLISVLSIHVVLNFVILRLIDVRETIREQRTEIEQLRNMVQLDSKHQVGDEK